MTIQLEAHSQSDTAGKVWIPRADALRKLQQAQLYEVYKEYVELLKTDTATLAGRIRELNGAISSLNRSIDSYKRDSTSYVKIVALYESKEAIYKKEKEDLEKALKKANRKARWAAIGGTVATLAAIIIPILNK